MEFSECLQPVMVESEYEGFGCEDELPEDCVFAVGVDDEDRKMFDNLQRVSADLEAAYQNLTATQAKCTELLEAKRELVAEVDGLRIENISLAHQVQEALAAAGKSDPSCFDMVVTARNEAMNERDALERACAKALTERDEAIVRAEKAEVLSQDLACRVDMLKDQLQEAVDSGKMVDWFESLKQSRDEAIKELHSLQTANARLYAEAKASKAEADAMQTLAEEQTERAEKAEARRDELERLVAKTWAERDEAYFRAEKAEAEVERLRGVKADDVPFDALDAIADELNSISVSNGWYEPEPSISDFCANVHAEVSELFQAYRENKLHEQCPKETPRHLSNFAEEIRDIITRSLCFSAWHGIPIGDAVRMKADVNRKRGW